MCTLIGPEEFIRNRPHNQLASLDGITLASDTTVRNHQVIFDQDLYFKSHIIQMTKIFFYSFKIRKILPQSDAEKTSPCICYFKTVPLQFLVKVFLNSFDLFQSAASGVLVRINRTGHTSPITASLHWPPVKSRIGIKTILFSHTNSLQ